MSVDIARVKKLLPVQIYNDLPAVLVKFKLDTPEKVANFLGQCHWESQGFAKFEENLNYSRGRLLEVFPKYFNLSNVDEYAGNPVKIASRVYANRMSNGNEESQDGWKYRGRGAIQLTGKMNYNRFSASVVENCIENPDLVASKYKLEAAGWFFYVHGLDVKGDDVSRETTAAITKVINGAFDKVNSRYDLTKRYYDALLS